jgi:S-formylglutathione hydrolase
VNAIIREVIVHSRSLEGNLLGDSPDRTVHIYLPPRYDADFSKRFPVYYFLHGHDCRSDLYSSGRIGGMKIEEALGERMTNGSIPEMIMVVPDAFNRYHGTVYVNSSVSGKWEDFLCKELVSHVDSNYRTVAEPAYRGLAGESMGAYSALYVGMRNPELFSAIYSGCGSPADFDLFPLPVYWQEMSLLKDPSEASLLQLSLLSICADFSPNPNRPPFYGDFPYDVIEGKAVANQQVMKTWRAYDLFGMVSRHKRNLKRMRAIRLDIGDQDGAYLSNYLFAQELNRHGIKCDLRPYRGGHLDEQKERLEQKVPDFFAEAFGGI